MKNEIKKPHDHSGVELILVFLMFACEVVVTVAAAFFLFKLIFLGL